MSPAVLLGAVLLAVGGGLLTVGGLGWGRRLRPNRFAGVRTPATLRSPEAFTVANRVAAPPVMAAGGACLVGGVLAIGAGGAVPYVIVGVVGVATLLLVGAGGVLGDRAAAAVWPRPASCGGCACGAGGCAAR